MPQYAIYNQQTQQFITGTHIKKGSHHLSESKKPEKMYASEKRAHRGLETLNNKVKSLNVNKVSIEEVKEMTDKDIIFQLEQKLRAYRSFESEMDTLGHKLGENSRLEWASEELEKELKEAETFEYRVKPPNL